jgi:large conductance mechanosensitive channel
MLKEFRDFVLRGNLVTLAVAFVMGAAFAALVTAFVTDLVMPIIAAIFGKADFSGLTFTIHHSVFLYGSFLTALIVFLTIAAAIFFFVVKPVDMIEKRRARGDEPTPPSDEERRHQELLAAIQGLKS